MSLVELPHVKTSESNEDFDNMIWQEFTLDDDAILCDIPPVPHGPYELLTVVGTSPLSTPPSTPALSVNSIIHTPSKHQSTSSDSQSEVIKSKKAIFMQMIIAAEDDLVKALRGALSLSDESERHTFQRHISPSIEEQLSGRYDPPPLTYGDKENKNLTSVPSPPKRSRVLPALELQKKEKHHQSYGVH